MYIYIYKFHICRFGQRFAANFPFCLSPRIGWREILQENLRNGVQKAVSRWIPTISIDPWNPWWNLPYFNGKTVTCFSPNRLRMSLVAWKIMLMMLRPYWRLLCHRGAIQATDGSLTGWWQNQDEDHGGVHHLTWGYCGYRTNDDLVGGGYEKDLSKCFWENE